MQPSASAEPELSAPEQFAADLKLWQDQVAKAVLEGSDHLKERVEEICTHQTSSQANGVGAALIIQLEEAVSSAVKGIKSRIQSSVEDISEDTSEQELSSVQEKLANRIRLAGQSIKTKAQSVREWKKEYDQETNALVEAAANSTLETIDNIRDLRLQDIGRRWSSNEKITHKSWAKYSELKKASSQWRDQVATIALSHPKLAEAREAGSTVEEKAMEIASGGAQELARLKSVAQWKIDARDASDDFNTKVIPAGVAKAKQQVLDKISDASEAVVATAQTQGTVESMTSEASKKASELASSASEAVLGSQTPSGAASAASSISEKVFGTSQGTIESVTSQASKKAAELASSASEAVAGSQTASRVANVASSISETIIGTQQPVLESVTSVVEKSAESVSSAISDKLVGSSQPVLESAASVASAISETVIGTSQHVVESVTSVVGKSAESAATDLSETVIGTQQPVIESVTSVIGKSAESAATALSETIIGTSQPVAESVASVAQESAKSVATAASEAIIGTSQPVVKSVASVAKESAQSAVDAASVTLSTPTIIESAIYEASSSLSSVTSSIASAAPVKSVFGGAMAQVVPDRQVVLDDMVDDDDEGSYSSSMLSMINNAMGEARSLTQAVQDALRTSTEQGTVGSVSSVASEQYASAYSAASNVFYGTAPGAGGAIPQFASEKYDQAVAA